MTYSTQKKIPANTIHITDKAASKVKEFAKNEGKGAFGLRVAVKRCMICLFLSINMDL